MEEYNFEFAAFQNLAQSMTDGIADYKYFLWVPDWLQDSEEKDYLVLLNTGNRTETEFKIIYKFKAEYTRNKCCFAISQDGRFVVAGYSAKKGIICYDCENGNILWNNPKIKKIDNIRFNNFNPDIIEVINSNLEFIYLNKNTGHILEPCQKKNIRQIINWMRSSKNGKYLITADYFSNKEKSNYTVYNTETKELKGRFVAQSQINSKTFDITNDGEFAVCSAYQKQGISLIKVSTGEILWTQQKTKQISMVHFNKTDDKVVVCCRYNGIYFLNIQNGEIESELNGEKLYLNTYGEDILFSNDKVAKVGNHQIECPTFSWIDALGIKDGVLLQLAGMDGLMLYDYNGNLLWKNEELFGNVAYLEEENIICTFCSVDHVNKITLASAKDGQILTTTNIPEYACAFIHNNKTIVCNTGKMYDISNNSINEINTTFELLIELPS